MSDPRPRTPHFLETTAADGAAMPAAFERMRHPRASVPSPRASVPAAAPTPTLTHTHHSPLPTPAAPGGAPRSSPPSPTPSSPDFAPASLDPHPQLAAAIEHLRLHASRLAEQARADALEIGFQVARRIVEIELSASPEPLFALVKSAVRRVGDTRRLIIRAHPDDAKLIDAPEGRQRLGLTLLHVEVTSDATLSRGDCVVESDNTTVDGRISTRLDELRRGVTAALAEEDP